MKHDDPKAVDAEKERKRTAAYLDVGRGISDLYRGARSREKDLAREFKPALTPLGITIMRYVLEEEPVRATAISEALDLDKAIVSRQITALEKAGLVDSQPDPGDRRATLLVSSAAAHGATSHFTEQLRNEYRQNLHSWDLDEILTFARLLRKFNGIANQ